jgi:hypothetical protein
LILRYTCRTTCELAFVVFELVTGRHRASRWLGIQRILLVEPVVSQDHDLVLVAVEASCLPKCPSWLVSCMRVQFPPVR